MVVSTPEQKVLASSIAALLFIVLSLPFTYQLTDKIAKMAGSSFSGIQGPTVTGILVHGIVFFLIAIAIMYFSDNLGKEEKK